MTKRDKVADRKLAELETEFSLVLRTCLKECARGRWGLFGQNQGPAAERWLRWPEAQRLNALADEIRLIHQSLGVPNPECERFLHYCSLRGANIPGEPKLAKLFLEELESKTKSEEQDGH